MKNSKKCIKCDSDELVKIPSGIWNDSQNFIASGFSTFPVTRYMCVNCGYSEEWIESKKDRIKIKKKFK